MSVDELPIPENRNKLILFFAAIASGALLWGASHITYWPYILICAVGFSFTANTLFSLLHRLRRPFLLQLRLRYPPLTPQ